MKAKTTRIHAGPAVLLLGALAIGCGGERGAPARDGSGSSGGGDTAGAAAPASYPVEVPAGWSQDGLPPADALVRWGGCPFECCVYGVWKADSLRTARTEPRADAPVAFTLPAGRPFHAVTGQVRVTGLERVTFSDTLPQRAAGNGFTWTPSDTLYALDFQGEGYQAVWHDGAVKSELAFWGDSKLPVHVDGTYASAWWAQVADSTGRLGWLDMSDRGSHLHGVDACAGPSGIPADWTGPWVTWTSPGGTFAVDIPPGWSAYPRSRWSVDDPLPEGVIEAVELRTIRGVGAVVTVLRPDAAPPTDGSERVLASVDAEGRTYRVTAPATPPGDPAQADSVRARFVASLRPLGR